MSVTHIERWCCDWCATTAEVESNSDERDALCDGWADVDGFLICEVCASARKQALTVVRKARCKK